MNPAKGPYVLYESNSSSVTEDLSVTKISAPNAGQRGSRKNNSTQKEAGLLRSKGSVLYLHEGLTKPLTMKKNNHIKLR